ncbi:MAG: DUF4845 domain-containing protein [Gammaproteobacteria bacterium]|nr:DUF4845 domain-containing protein [Gammaproteobacteria bacterium]
MNTLKKQRGISMLGWVVIIMMIVVIGTGVLKLMPVYLEYYNVVSILENMKEDNALKGATKQQIASTFIKRMEINGINSLQKGDYSITKVEGKKAYDIQIYYEVRKTLMGNLSIVATFDRSVEVGG